MFYSNKDNNKHPKDVSKHSNEFQYLKANRNSKRKKNDNHLEDNSTPSSKHHSITIPDRNSKYFATKRKSQELQYERRSDVTRRKIEYSIKLRRQFTIHNSQYPIHHIIFLQYAWKKYYHKLNQKAEVIQASFLGYLLRKYLKEIQLEIKQRINGPEIINKLKPIYRIQTFYSKVITPKSLHQILMIQRQTKTFLQYKSLPMKTIVAHHFFIKGGTCYNNRIQTIQAKFKAYLEKRKTRRKVMKDFQATKIARPLTKILLLQRFIRFALSRKKKRPLISKNKMKMLYFFSKIIKSKSQDSLNEKKNKGNINPKIYQKMNEILRRVKYTIPSSQEYYTKTIKPITRIIMIQKAFKKRSIIEAHFLPVIKHMAFFRKKLQYQEYYTPIKFLQSQIRYLLFRLDNKFKILNKQRLTPMIFTKALITPLKKIFNRALQVRLEFDKELMNFLFTLHMILRRYYRRLFFQLISSSGRVSRGLIQIIKVGKAKDDTCLLHLDEDPLDLICLKKQSSLFQSLNLIERDSISISRNKKERTKSVMTAKVSVTKKTTTKGKRMFIDYRPKPFVNNNNNKECIIRAIDNYNADDYV